ncbi:hypothetical protein D3248_02100 [Leucobacter zeae]|nr:hypothetical protein [Leucobacter zeae]
MSFRLTHAISKLRARDQKSWQERDLPFTARDGRIFISHCALQAALPDEHARYDLVAYRDPTMLLGEFLRLRTTRGLPLWQRYSRPDEAFRTDPLQVYVNRRGFFSLVVRNSIAIDQNERRFVHSHEITSVDMRGDALMASFRIHTVEPGEFSMTRCFLRLESDDQLLEFDATRFDPAENGALRANVEFDGLSDADLIPLRYHLYVRLKDDATGNFIDLRINHLSRLLYQRIHRRFRASSITLPGERVFTLATNPRTTRMGFLIHNQSRYDRQIFRQWMFERLARFGTLFDSLFNRSRKPIALIYEKEAQTAQDNSFALHLHLLTARDVPPFDHAFIIDRDSAQWERVKDQKNVVAKFSLEYWYLLARSDSFLVSSESRFHLAHLYSRPDRANRYLFRKKHYFLQHGVTGLKRVSVFTPGSAIFPDYSVATSRWEKRVLVQAGMKPANVDITGFARWDRLALPPVTPQPVKKILYMPTWRNWLEGQNAEELQQSDYLRTTLEFLTSPELDSLLEQHGAELLFIPHPKAMDLLEAVTGLPKNVRLVSQHEIEFSKLIETTDALITDYSSIVWDFMRATKPVALFEFDKERYDSEVGAFSNAQLNKVKSSLRTAYTSSEMIAHIEDLITGHPESIRQEAEELLELAFMHTDRNNSARVVYALIRRLTSLTTLRDIPTYAQADGGYRKTIQRAVNIYDQAVHPD